MPDEEKPKKKDGESRILRGFISAIRPEMRREVKKGAEWARETAPSRHWLRSGLSERIFTVLINEAEKKAESQGGWLGTIVEAAASDASDIFGATFFAEEKEEATVAYGKYVKEKGGKFVAEAAERLRNAPDKGAEREKLRQEWLVEVETRKFLKELTESIKPSPKPKRKPTNWRKRLYGTKKKPGPVPKAKEKAHRTDIRVAATLRDTNRRLESWLDERGA
ncbi:MAG: hypothetical protein WD889_03285 [Candidatus Colwellbacteria bacterium]